jgi:hypothetical protein
VPIGVECERAEVRSDFKWWFWLFPPLALRFLMTSMFSSRGDELQGRQVAFRLPVRVCTGCRPRVKSGEGAREALLRSGLYARLLAKYPHATVTPPGE